MFEGAFIRRGSNIIYLENFKKFSQYFWIEILLFIYAYEIKL